MWRSGGLSTWAIVAVLETGLYEAMERFDAPSFSEVKFAARAGVDTPTLDRALRARERNESPKAPRSYEGVLLEAYRRHSPRRILSWMSRSDHYPKLTTDERV